MPGMEWVAFCVGQMNFVIAFQVRIWYFMNLADSNYRGGTEW
jgi:hypothetical protein